MFKGNVQGAAQSGYCFFQIFTGHSKKIPGPNKSIRGYPCFILETCGPASVCEGAPFGPGRSSDYRIILLATPSRSAQDGTVALCGFRPRLQRRARPRFTRGSLLSSGRAPGPICHFGTISGSGCQRISCLKGVASRLGNRKWRLHSNHRTSCLPPCYFLKGSMPLSGLTRISLDT